MSYQNGTATDIGNLMALINSFLTVGHSLDPAYTGTGTGTITNLLGTGASVLENITITFTSPTAFTVAGSVTGALAAGTVGVAYTSAVANFTVVAGGVAWVAGDTIIFTMTPPWTLKLSRGPVAVTSNNFLGTGNGLLSAIDNNTGTLVSAAANVVGWLAFQFLMPLEVRALSIQNFTTIGSGPTAFDLQFSDDGIAWTTAQSFAGITWPAINQVQVFTITAAHGTHLYWRINVTSVGAGAFCDMAEVRFWNDTARTQELLSTNGAQSNAELLWMAPGNDGVSQIFVGMQRFADPTGDYDNLRVGGFTGFSVNTAFALQPGAVKNCIMPGLRVGSFPYWMVANGRRFAIVTRPSTVYECAYMGFINTYASPGSWPYPLAVGASMAFGSTSSEPVATSVTWRWSYTGAEHCSYLHSPTGFGNFGDTYQMRLRDPAGAWLGFNGQSSNGSHGAPINGYVWPYCQTMDDFRPNLDGSYPLVPVILSSDKGQNQGQGSTAMAIDDTPNMYGELDGISAVTGHGNAAENTITVNRTTYLVTQNVYRTTKRDYFAMKLS